ncbi:hypothetical protein [Marinicella marina]|uniref:hypothetical protein n=1 Tax=Marinicella marina TaxID=2996016 RepID=UPI0024BCBE42|nr:hypothetical protein [Marinicella marina]MDJ1139834.1 hypothetical protein [Marinicella marina]
MRYFLLSLFLLAQTAPSIAQEIAAETAAETATEVLSFDNGNQIAAHLRSEYGIAKAVYLTQLAEQLSESFASKEQLQQQWLQALELTVAEPLNFARINSHALMVQSLIQHTNGMTLNRWRQINIPTQMRFNKPQQFKPDTDTFTTWLNLNAHWQYLMNDKRAKIASWNPWVVETASLNESNKKTADTKSEGDNNSVSLVLNLLLDENSIDAANINQLSLQTAQADPLAVALIRQQFHHETAHPLAMAYDWIEIYQLLELSPRLLTAEQQNQLANILSRTTTQWQSNEANINLINPDLFTLLNQVFIALPNKFKNPDHSDQGLNNAIFSFITGIQNPNTYFAHPLRQDIQENLEVCLNLSAQQRPEPPLPIADSQFESCLDEFINWGSNLSKSADFAGNLIKLDNPASINRAVELPAVQIINNLAIHAAGDVSCKQQTKNRSNWVEWSMAAATLAWFNDRWPALMATQQTNQILEPMLRAGENIFDYSACIADNAPLQTQFEVVLNKWQRLKQEIITHVNQFMIERLTPNSDVDLFKSIDQVTQYVPEDLTIGPCDVAQSCGAFVTLEPSIELLNLFPNHLKLAEQFGLGKLAICYEEVQWVNRETAPTHLDNNKIANFSGQLALQLTGKYQEKDVFTKQFVSEQSHIYLFGENNTEVLDTACPLKLIGKQINTTLDRGTFGLLPNRLTFLTAAKVDVNAVIDNNWQSWLNSLQNSQDNFVYFDEMNEVRSTLNDAFLQQANDLQQEIYRKLIANNISRSNDSALSRATFDFITHRKLLERMATGLYPHLLAADAKLHAAINGQERLVDMQFFRSAFQTQKNLVDMLNFADENFIQHQNVWQSTNLADSAIQTSLEQLHSIRQSHTSKVAEAAEE